jgi:hypothetical protein
MGAAVKTVMTSLPGKVVSYDPSTKLATVEPMVHNGNPLPPIPEVPIKWPRFGGYRLVGPLNAGDEVTLHFHKWDPSRFRVSGEKSQANLSRDTGIYAYAVPGSESETSTYNGGGSGLHIGKDDGAVEIVVTPTQIKLGASGAASGVAKGDLVDSNFDAIVEFLTTHVHPTPAGPSSPPGPSPLPPTLDPTESTKVFTQ